MQLNQPFDTGNLELLARQVVEGFIIGLHKSPFHGFSVEFAEHRLYNPGDNLRYIDWKVYGKSDKMFVKKFEEETNLKCCIAIDTSASMRFPESGMNKLYFSCLAAAALMQLLRKQLDATALKLFADQVYWSSPIKSSERHYKMLITEMEKLLLAPSTEGQTNLPHILHHIAETMPKRSLVIVFSDFMDDLSREEAFYDSLQHLKHQQNEVIVFHVGEGSKEWEFAFENRPYEFVDMETGQKIKLKPEQVKEQYLDQLKAYHQRLYEHCAQYNIDLVACDINTSMDIILQQYLRKRNKLM